MGIRKQKGCLEGEVEKKRREIWSLMDDMKQVEVEAEDKKEVLASLKKDKERAEEVCRRVEKELEVLQR